MAKIRQLFFRFTAALCIAAAGVQRNGNFFLIIFFAAVVTWWITGLQVKRDGRFKHLEQAKSAFYSFPLKT